MMPNARSRDHRFGLYALRSLAGRNFFLRAFERGERGEQICAKQKLGVGLCGDLQGEQKSEIEQNLLEKERQKSPKMDEQVVRKKFIIGRGNTHKVFAGLQADFGVAPRYEAVCKYPD